MSFYVFFMFFFICCLAYSCLFIFLDLLLFLFLSSHACVVSSYQAKRT